jgi:hypothetical protein
MFGKIQLKQINIIWMLLILLIILVNVFHALAEYLTYLIVSGGYGIELNPLVANMINIQHNYILAFVLTTGIIEARILLIFGVFWVFYYVFRIISKSYNFNQTTYNTIRTYSLAAFFTFAFIYLILLVISTFTDFYGDYHFLFLYGGI